MTEVQYILITLDGIELRHFTIQGPTERARVQARSPQTDPYVSF